jgi:hypothetical protein
VSSAMTVGASLRHGQVLAPAGGWRRWLCAGRCLASWSVASHGEHWFTDALLLLHLLCCGVTLEVGSGRLAAVRSGIVVVRGMRRASPSGGDAEEVGAGCYLVHERAADMVQSGESLHRCR